MHLRERGAVTPVRGAKAPSSPRRLHFPPTHTLRVENAGNCSKWVRNGRSPAAQLAEAPEPAAAEANPAPASASAVAAVPAEAEATRADPAVSPLPGRASFGSPSASGSSAALATAARTSASSSDHTRTVLSIPLDTKDSPERWTAWAAGEMRAAGAVSSASRARPRGVRTTLSTSSRWPLCPAKTVTHTPARTSHRRTLSSLDADSSSFGSVGCSFRSFTAFPCPTSTCSPGVVVGRVTGRACGRVATHPAALMRLGVQHLDQAAIARHRHQRVRISPMWHPY